MQLQTPIKAPLELLDISNCKIIVLPNWGILPHLTHYNISHNPLSTLEPSHFAPMCKLEKVDITNAIDKNSKSVLLRRKSLEFLMGPINGAKQLIYSFRATKRPAGRG
ncbi:unnamed protein product [Diatraea saccharalis]|uniref:Uncharacterized protein n=1 Tax=Diatraea saccharalis TaxID=40085 RepID=A0A9N9RGY7_9NEOP|nr:unnamed protein product [Diatraea saccharalis]